MTKFRLGLLFGFASGYYLGTKAGRERVHDAVDQPHDPVMATYIAN